MAVPSKAAYDATEIDWDKLRAYARRVAKATSVPPQPELVLSVIASETRQVPVRTGGFLGFGASTRMETRTEHTELAQHVLGRHWVLDTRRSEEFAWNGKSMMQTDIQVSYLVLLADGELATVLHVNRYRSIMPEHLRGEGRTEVDDNYATKGVFTDRDVTWFDFEKVRYHMTPRRSGVTGGEFMNEINGDRPQRHAKGVGLSLRLKALTEGPLEERAVYNKHRR